MGYYQLNAEKLKPGDVILEAGDGLVSELIKFSDRLNLWESGRFSHALVYVGMSYIMEADEGVRSIMASRIITDNTNKFLILRHPNFPEGIQVSWLAEFAGAATFLAIHSEANKPYNWKGMFATKIPFISSSDNKFFCSQLVSEAYKRLGIRLFSDNRAPERVTPNAFLSKECVLRPIETEECFHRLPDHEWINKVAKRSRYDVIKSEGIPLAQIGHELSQEIVRIFGPRVDELTNRIGKKQSITSPQDLFITLYYPDLPDAEQMSDEVTEFMKINYPSNQIAEHIYTAKCMFDFALDSSDSTMISMLKSTLQRDIDAVESLLPILSQQVSIMDVFPPPPLKKRSIHFWIQAKLKETVQLEGEFLTWRKSVLQKINISG